MSVLTPIAHQIFIADIESASCRWIFWGLLLVCVCLLPKSAVANDARTIPVLYLQQVLEHPPVLSNILPEPEDSGFQGVKLGASDNNTSGKFLGHHYQLVALVSKSVDDLLAKAADWLSDGHSLIVVNVPRKTLLALMTLPGMSTQALVFNAGAADDELRVKECRSRLLHTIPSRAMLADALAQFLIARRWNRWLLITGGQPDDVAFAAALKRSAKRFGGMLVDTRVWSFATDLRRTAQQELPLFTQTEPYHITLVADEQGDVGEYVLYNSWYPRPVAGTQGLTPVAWHRVVEQWGAAQLQRRFEALAGRWMNSQDYAAWIAMRAIAEAVTQTASQWISQTSEIDSEVLYRYLLSDALQLAGFKGRPLSFRAWNGQLRQPIPLVHPRALVSQSPQEGFLHPVTDLDTLGYDRSEVQCVLGAK